MYMVVWLGEEGRLEHESFNTLDAMEAFYKRVSWRKCLILESESKIKTDERF